MHSSRSGNTSTVEQPARLDTQEGDNDRNAMNHTVSNGVDSSQHFATTRHFDAEQYNRAFYEMMNAEAAQASASTSSHSSQMQNQNVKTGQPGQYIQSPQQFHDQQSQTSRWGDGGLSFQQQLVQYQQNALLAHDVRSNMARDHSNESNSSGNWQDMQGSAAVHPPASGDAHNHPGQTSSQTQLYGHPSMSAGNETAPQYSWNNEQMAMPSQAMQYAVGFGQRRSSTTAGAGHSTALPNGSVTPHDNGFRPQSGLMQYHDFGQVQHPIHSRDYATDNGVAQGAYLSSSFHGSAAEPVIAPNETGQYGLLSSNHNTSHPLSTYMGDAGSSAFPNSAIGSMSSYNFSGLPMYAVLPDHRNGQQNAESSHIHVIGASATDHSDEQSPSHSVDGFANGFESADDSGSSSAKLPNVLLGDDDVDDSPSLARHGNSSEGLSSKARKSARKVYECSQCTRTFPRPSALIVHERIHSGQKPFVCEVCDRPFTVASNLRRHLKIHAKQLKTEATMFVAQSETSTLRPAGGDRNKMAPVEDASLTGIDKVVSDDEAASTDGSIRSYPTTRTSMSASTMQNSDSRAGLGSPQMRPSQDVYYQGHSSDISSWSHSLQAFNATQSA